MARVRVGGHDFLWFLYRGGRVAVSRAGSDGLVLAGAMLLMSALLISWSHWERKTELQRVQLMVAQDLARKHALDEVELRRLEDPRVALAEFENQLPAYEDISLILEEIFTLAQKCGLTLARGEYRPQADVAGHYLRYRMILPVTGDARAIQRFIQESLVLRKTLLFESIQFQRERIEATVVETRIQWSLLTRLPIDKRIGSTASPAVGANVNPRTL